MAYALHIEDTGKTLPQWVEFVRQRPDLELVHEAVATNPVTGEVIRVESPNTARAENGALFVPRESDRAFVVTVSSPDEETIQLMKEIARVLGGRVVGDEGEAY